MMQCKNEIQEKIQLKKETKNQRNPKNFSKEIHETATKKLMNRMLGEDR